MIEFTRSQVLAGLAGIGLGGLATLGVEALRGDRAEQSVGAPVARELSREDRARLVGYFPDVTLTTHDNRKVRLYEDLIRDKFVVFSLMYTACVDLCPLTTANLIAAKAALGERVGRDVFFYGLTLDPVLDTPEQLNEYARYVGAGDGYLFLTGAPDDIYRTRRKLGLFDPDPVIDADKSSHGALAVYGNEPKGLWGGVPALIRPERIIHRLRRALA